MTLKLISHNLCPYVQRAAIALMEKGVPFERTDIDLSNKPDWFLKLSPLGKTPVLIVNNMPIFESAVILEYLEDTQPPALHPEDPLERAQHRGWIEFASAILNDIAGLYNAVDQGAFADKQAELGRKFARLESQLGNGPFFSGSDFSLVDAAFAPVFRYFDTIDEIVGLGLFDDAPKVSAWRKSLSDRPSVQKAVSADYPLRLREFLQKRNSVLSGLILKDTQSAA
jgi:glutathione S-transferase